jgi:hypothetical protein
MLSGYTQGAIDRARDSGSVKEEIHTCMSYEEEDTCMSYEEIDRARDKRLSQTYHVQWRMHL